MDEEPELRLLFHRLNNQLGIILANAELLEVKAADEMGRARASQVVASVLEADVIRRDSRATEVWQDDDFGTRELVKQGWSYRDAAMEGERRVLERALAELITLQTAARVGVSYL